jgi:NitT/TauT family transport system substrate-binding protein
VGRKPTTAVLAALLALVVFTAACGGDDDGAEGTTETTESAGGNDNGELTPITVGILPIAALAPLWYGIEQGYFEDEGLDVSTEIGSSGAQLAPAVLNGDYQFAVGEYLSIMQARENDVGIQVVANLTNGADAADQAINALLVKADSGIDGVEDLAGKTIAVNGLGGIEEIAVRAILEDRGVDPSGVEFTEIAFPDMNAAVEAGEADVAAQLEPFITLGEQAGLVNLLDPFYESIPGMPLGLFFGSEEWLAENPDLAEAFVRALDRSIQASSDTEAMKETIVANTETDAELVDQIALDHWVADIDRDKLQTIGALATTYGILEEEPNLDELIWTG